MYCGTADWNKNRGNAVRRKLLQAGRTSLAEVCKSGLDVPRHERSGRPGMLGFNVDL